MFSVSIKQYYDNKINTCVVLKCLNPAAQSDFFFFII